MDKVVIAIRGGVLVGVYASDADVTVKLYDFDNTDLSQAAEADLKAAFEADIVGLADVNWE